MIKEQTLTQTDSTALRTGAAIQLRPTGGVLVLTDADRSDFLHRMTTNNINALKPGQSAVTVLTSPTARIVFVFTVICRPDDLLVLPALGEAAALERYLRGQIFFMDKVKVRNASAEYARLRVMGAKAGAALTTLGFALDQASEGAWQAQLNVLAVKQLAYDVPGYEVIVPTAQLPSFMDGLTTAGGSVLEDETSYHARRVELGRPLPGRELIGDYNPLEAGLAWTCADNKGCYTGQEIIARQITYDKVTKTLVGLRSAEPLTVGAALTVEGRDAGIVTSLAHSQALDAPIALAIIKRAYNTPGTHVSENGLAAEVVGLPFVVEYSMDTFEPATWRLILEDEPRSGPANMAIDQAIATACAAGESPPTLRFYRWLPPAISLGRHQAIAELDLAAAAAHGYDVVRRSTGGRAILHTDELTYSVAAPADEPRVKGGVMDAYLRLSNALVTGLRVLGVAADKAGGDTRVGTDVSAACFEVPSAYEITVRGRKLLGSAQSRRAKYVLQHGSLPLTGDITRLVDGLVLAPDEAVALRQQLVTRACTLAQALDGVDHAPVVEFTRVAQALVQGFCAELNLNCKPGQLTPSELRTAAQLIREQYANPAWTQSR